MSFWNSFKILITRFGYVGRVAIYLFVALVIIGGISAAVLIPVGIEIFHSETIVIEYGYFNEALRGGNVAEIFREARELSRYFFDEVINSVGSIISLAFFAFVVMGILARYLLGLYELPLAEVLDTYLTTGAKTSFAGRLVASIGRSSKLVLYKSIFLLLYDILMAAIVFATLNLFRIQNSVVDIITPFFAMVVLICMLAFRSVLTTSWTPLVVIDKMKPLEALFAGVKVGFGNFGRLFSVYLVTWLIVVVINYIAAVNAFGVGLILTIPISVVFLKILSLVFFYNRTNRRYYVDGEIFTPLGASISEE